MEIEMDELVLEVDAEEATSSDKVMKSEQEDDLNSMKHCTDLVTDMEVIVPTGNNGDKESELSPSEPGWLEKDEPIALWVKWRGKWQAGIRCAKADWPLMTLKGKPTHDRKKYCVVYFPHTKNYSWADMQLVRSINEFPDPIAYKSHKVGIELVKDLTIARRYVMRKLTVMMFNIVDQFPSEVVVEAGRDIIMWKEFAMGATKSTSYHDLGLMLLKLHSMILQRYIDPIWLENAFPLWIQKCNSAENAESIELLKEEFDNCIKWNEVKSLPMQSMVFSEWKTWKHDIAKWFSISRHSVGEIAEQNGESVFNSDVQASHKRPKLEIRRAETTNTSQILTEASSPQEANPIMNEPTNGLDLWDGIVVEAGGSELTKTKQVNRLSHPEDIHTHELALKKPSGSGSKSQQCRAFIESKGKQCGRWANDGDVYCCVHLASRSTSKSIKSESFPSVDAPMCGGITVLGTKCKHRSLPGSFFCKKHRPQTGIEAPDSLPMKRNLEEIMPNLETNECQDLVPFGESTQDPSFATTTSFNEMFEHCSKDDNLCVGYCSDNSYVPCNEFAAKHSLYCEKHLPSWLKRARNGKSRIITKEVFVDLLKGCSSREEKLALHQACDIFYKFFKSALSLRNSTPIEVQLDWAKTEASRNANAGIGEFLMKLVSLEKERLAKIWGFGADEEAVPYGHLAITNGCDDNVEGEETRDEDKWSFRGFGCAICFDSFVNRKLLETHAEERHHVQFTEKCMLLQCILCGSNFGDEEQLLVHVQAVHPSVCKSLTVSSESSQKPEAGSSQIVVRQNKESTKGVHKYVCKYCGLKFNLLPEIGRHHQAEHMEQNLVGSRGPKKGLRVNTYQLKSGRNSRPNKFKKSLGAVSYRIRNRASVNMKRRMQGSKGNTRALPPPSDGLADDNFSLDSDILLTIVQEAKHRPNNLDILSAARSACCRVSFETSLEAKFGYFPDRMYLKAAKLCGEQGVQVKWHQEGYICSNGCKPVKDSELLLPLIPRQENDRFKLAMEPTQHSNNELEVDECHCIMEAHHFSKKPSGSGNTAVLCNDISFGKEPVPIRVVYDDHLNSEKPYEKPWELFTYVTKSMLHPSMDFLKEFMMQNRQLKCGCRSSVCSPKTCDHVRLFGTDFEDPRDIYFKPMKGRFPYDDKERIILEEGYPVFECNEHCRCSRTCQNRVLQKGIRMKLEVFRTESKGWGLRACDHILRGTFVCEFIGEIVDQQEANTRRNNYREGGSYIQEIDYNINDIGRMIEGEPDYAIDATTHGNISRFINHSCSPNLIYHQIVIESTESPLTHIGLYASMDIAAGEEITRDYGRRPVITGQANEYPCHCKATTCRGRLFC